MAKFKKKPFCKRSFLGRPAYKSIGYSRISSAEQDDMAQVTALEENGCHRVFREISNSTSFEFPKNQLYKALASMNEGDELVIVTLDRIGRNQKELISTICELQLEKKHLRTLDEKINTRKLGKCALEMLELLAGLNHAERAFNREKALESIKQRLDKGIKIQGRPKTNQAKELLVIRLRNEGFSYRSIREQTGLALSTIRRIIVQKEEELRSARIPKTVSTGQNKQPESEIIMKDNNEE